MDKIIIDLEEAEDKLKKQLPEEEWVKVYQYLISCEIVPDPIPEQEYQTAVEEIKELKEVEEDGKNQRLDRD